MQYDGWLETMLQARFPKHELVVRNLGFSGDEVSTRPRSKNFGTPDEWLSGLAQPIGGYEDNRLAGTNTRADVVFAFFGYNESFAGQAGLDAFKKDLTAWIAHTIAQKYNGKSAPRVVLFSPLAQEDLGNPDLPDGKENNQRLALYTKAMADAASAGNITFVDLYTPSARLYADNKAPLTIQGIHLNPEGNRQIAQVIDRTLFGDTPKHQETLLTKLRQAVVDKDRLWFQRYRVTDGYSTYGDRAFLTFVRGNPRNVDAKQMAGVAKEDVLPSNYDVLQRELPILDQMISNRDKRIWAVAGGGDLTVDDSNTLPFVDARTNMSSVSPFKSGDETIKAMTIGQGLKVELFASEKEFPELVKPVQMAFDTKGRLWVAAWKNYPHWQPKTPMDDKLLILEDTNGDGKADKCTVFAGDLQNPTGFEFWNGGVLVGQQPNLVFLKDTNGDDKYDTREIVLHGFDSADTHHAHQQLHVRWGRRAVFSGRHLSPHIGRDAVGTGHAPERRRRLPVRAANLEIRDLRALQFSEPAWPRLRPVEPGHRVRRNRRSAVLRTIVLDQEVLPRDGDQAGAEARRRQDPADRRRGTALEPALSRGYAGQSHRAQHDRVQRAVELQDQ